MAKDQKKIQQRKFKGIWIPRELWLDDKLSITEKALLVEIDSLDNENGCVAGNQYFADFFKLKVRQIKSYVSTLREKRYINVELIGRNRRRITLRAENYPQRVQKIALTEGRKLHHSNTENNTDNNSAKPNGSAIEFDLKREIQKLEDSPQRHVQLIGEFLKEKGTRLENHAQLKRAIARHFKSARALADFSDKQIGDASFQAARDYPGIWTLETVVKILTR